MGYFFKIQKRHYNYKCFSKILGESNRKPNLIWVDKSREFYTKSIKSWLEKNAMKMYSTHDEGKSIVVEKFIRTLKNNIYKYMTSISKNVYVDKLDDIYHRAINMKPADVKPSMYFDFNKENNKESPKFKIGDNVRISK